MAPLACRRWSEQEFTGSRGAWNALLARSGADPLFSCWEWQHAWWRHHARALSAELRIFAVSAGSGELLGLAPCYSRIATHGRLLRARRLELIGNAWRATSPVFSEYLDVIAAPEARAEVVSTLVRALADDGWDEFALVNMRPASTAALLARGLARGAYVRRAETLTAWSIGLGGSFDAFAARLQSNTRRKVLHQRAKLGDAHCVDVARSRWPETLARLENLVAARWGRGADPTIQAFHAEVLDSLDASAVRLTELRAGSTTVSVMLNLRAGDTEYYLQSGFDAGFARGLSPGYLHLGFAIESAWRDGLRRFDLLAGRGLHRDYKRDLAAAGTTLETLHLLRRGALRVLFRVADGIRGRTDITYPA